MDHFFGLPEVALRCVSKPILHILSSSACGLDRKIEHKRKRDREREASKETRTCFSFSDKTNYTSEREKNGGYVCEFYNKFLQKKGQTFALLLEERKE
jgi:hypothetical protein